MLKQTELIIPDREKSTILYIRWVDANSDKGPYGPGEALRQGVVCDVAGWLVGETKEFVTVALETSITAGARFLLNIPKVAIQERKVLK